MYELSAFKDSSDSSLALFERRDINKRIGKLPSSHFKWILDYLSPEDLARLSPMAEFMRDFIVQSGDLWKKKILRDFRFIMPSLRLAMSQRQLPKEFFFELYHALRKGEYAFRVSKLGKFGTAIRSLAVVASGRRFVLGLDDAVVRVCTLKNKAYNLSAASIRSSDWTPSVAVDSNRGRIISGSWNGKVSVWKLSSDGQTYVFLNALAGHSDLVTRVAVDSNTGRIVSGSVDGRVVVWDLSPDGRAYKRFAVLTDKHTGGVTSVAIDSNTRRIVLGSGDQTVRVFALSPTGVDYNLCATLNQTSAVTSVAIDSITGRIVSGSVDKRVRVWDLSPDGKTYRLFATLNGHTAQVTSVAIDAKMGWIVSGSNDRTACVFALSPDGQTYHLRATLLGGTSRNVLSVAIAARTSRIFLGSQDGTVSVGTISQAIIDRIESRCDFRYNRDLNGKLCPIRTRFKELYNDSLSCVRGFLTTRDQEAFTLVNREMAKKQLKI